MKALNTPQSSTVLLCFAGCHLWLRASRPNSQSVLLLSSHLLRLYPSVATQGRPSTVIKYKIETMRRPHFPLRCSIICVLTRFYLCKGFTLLFMIVFFFRNNSHPPLTRSTWEQIRGGRPFIPLSSAKLPSSVVKLFSSLLVSLYYYHYLIKYGLRLSWQSGSWMSGRNEK